MIDAAGQRGVILRQYFTTNMRVPPSRAKFPVTSDQFPVPRNIFPVNLLRELLEKLLRHRGFLL